MQDGRVSTASLIYEWSHHGSPVTEITDSVFLLLVIPLACHFATGWEKNLRAALCNDYPLRSDSRNNPAMPSQRAIASARIELLPL